MLDTFENSFTTIGVLANRGFSATNPYHPCLAGEAGARRGLETKDNDKDPGSEQLGCAKRAPNTFEHPAGNLLCRTGGGPKAGPNEPKIPGTVPKDRHTTIPNDSGPISFFLRRRSAVHFHFEVL